MRDKQAEFMIVNHRVDFLEQDNRPKTIKVLAFVYKMFRVYYSCLVFYFIPFAVLIVPYIMDTE
jgi:hypothetical protein